MRIFVVYKSYPTQKVLVDIVLYRVMREKDLQYANRFLIEKD